MEIFSQIKSKAWLDVGERMLSPRYKFKSCNSHVITKHQGRSHLACSHLASDRYVNPSSWSVLLLEPYLPVPCENPTPPKNLGQGQRSFTALTPISFSLCCWPWTLPFKPVGPTNMGTSKWGSGGTGRHQLEWGNRTHWAWFLSTAWDSDPWRPAGDLKKAQPIQECRFSQPRDAVFEDGGQGGKDLDETDQLCLETLPPAGP